ncbi:MAG: TatD family hydrolase [Candidatus Omnitrophota bacterium]
MLIDTHCHLDFPEFDRDRAKVIQRSRHEGIDYIVNIGSSLRGSRQSIELAGRYDFIYATVGLHPHEADRTNQEIQNTLSDLAKQNKVVAIGEIGLDYFKNYSKPENQRPLFKLQLRLAKSLNLPVVIHNRQAQNDTLAILEENMPLKAVVHCFSGDENFLNQCLDLGLFISFTCNITYKKADTLRSLVKLAPMDKLMLETDAPFLSPQEHRGRRNEPIYVKSLADKIASIKGISFEEVARVTTENAKNFFKLR